MIERLYALFRYNIDTLLKHNIFKIETVPILDVINSECGIIWNWSSEEERIETIHSIEDHGLYYPIFTLPKGKNNNKIEDRLHIKSIIEYFGFYYISDGNHQLDALKSIRNKKNGDHRILYDNDNPFFINIMVIPSYCENNYNGSEYTSIDYCLNLPSIVKKHFLPGEIGDIKLFHISTCNDDINLYNSPTCVRNFYPDIDYIYAVDYQMCFRILQEFKNVLEVTLTKYYHQYHKLPSGIDTSWCNPQLQDEHFNKCPYKSSNTNTCFILGAERHCSFSICCESCNKEDCKGRCSYYKNKE